MWDTGRSGQGRWPLFSTCGHLFDVMATRGGADEDWRGALVENLAEWQDTARPRKPASAAAVAASSTNRRNKLQRCGVCGGLGHKSRTCTMVAPVAPERGGRKDTVSAVSAAHGLLALAYSHALPIDEVVRSCSPTPMLTGL